MTWSREGDRHRLEHRRHCTDGWDGIIPVLHDYIAIPNVSEVFDPE